MNTGSGKPFIGMPVVGTPEPAWCAKIRAVKDKIPAAVAALQQLYQDYNCPQSNHSICAEITNLISLLQASESGCVTVMNIGGCNE